MTDRTGGFAPVGTPNGHPDAQAHWGTAGRRSRRPRKGRSAPTSATNSWAAAALREGGRHVEHGGGLLDGEPAEQPQIHELALARRQLRQPLERRIRSQDGDVERVGFRIAVLTGSAAMVCAAIAKDCARFCHFT